jgi:hypothetical protein
MQHVKQYLRKRRCSCTLSDKTVAAKLVMGSPQGGILSPSCGWKCAMNELLARLKKTKKTTAFADDGALITCSLKLSEAMKDAQKAINVAAVEWAKEMGVEFSVEKTVVMLFTKKRASSYKMPTQLRLYGKEIPFSKTAKYLGITLDDKLSWRPHIVRLNMTNRLKLTG